MVKKTPTSALLEVQAAELQSSLGKFVLPRTVVYLRFCRQCQQGSPRQRWQKSSASCGRDRAVKTHKTSVHDTPVKRRCWRYHLTPEASRAKVQADLNANLCGLLRRRSCFDM